MAASRKSTAPRRPYKSVVRRAQEEERRDSIVEATHELLKTTRPVDLSYSEVASRAGVSIRTVYRQFPTEDDLFRAVSDRVVGEWDVPEEWTVVSGLRHVATMFQRLDRDPALFRLFFAVPTRSRFDTRALFAQVFGPHVERLRPNDRRATYALLELVTSPYAWDVLHNYWNLSARRALRVVVVTIQAVLEYLERHPEALDLRSPPPPIARTGGVS